MPHTPVNRCVRSHERHPFKAACVNELEFSPTKPFGEKERNSNVVRRTMWRKKVISTFKGGGMRQNYSNSKHPGGAGRAGGTIKKFSRQQNGSRRMKWKGEANGGEPNCGPSTQPIQLLDRHIYKKPSVTINLFFSKLGQWFVEPTSG